MQTAAIILDFITLQGTYARVRILVEAIDRREALQKLYDLALNEVPCGAVIRSGTVEWIPSNDFTF